MLNKYRFNTVKILKFREKIIIQDFCKHFTHFLAKRMAIFTIESG